VVNDPEFCGPSGLGVTIDVEDSMKRLVLMMGLLLPACADSGKPVFIFQNQVMMAGCVVPSSEGTAFNPQGELDTTNPLPGSTTVNPGYIFGALIENLTMASTTDPTLHTMFVQGADVELVAAPTTASQNLITSLAAGGNTKRTARFSGAIKAGGAAGIPFPIIDTSQSDAIGASISGTGFTQVIAKIKVWGQMDGGDVVTPEFEFPVNVCKGCLFADVGACTSLTAASTNKGGPCNILADGNLDCCDNATGGLTCPAHP
jgi:hypothetical protein